MHKSIAVVAFASVAVLLAACQGPPGDLTDPLACAPVEAGQDSDAIQVRGAELEAPQVSFPESLEPLRTQRTVIEPGDGRLAEVGSFVTFAYAAFNGNTGEPIDAVGYGTPRSQATLDRTSLVPGFEDALLCSNAGARIAAVIPPMDAFGEAGHERYGIGASDPVVLVVDLIAVAADRATGEPQTVRDSLPQVNVAATGEPQVSVPPTAPPAESSATVLKKGDGDVVTEGATVTLEYLGVIWGSGRIFDSSWPREELVRMPTSNFLEGFGNALVGQTVGSQVLVILPPHTAYGEAGNPGMGIDANDTIVFVIDILAVVAPATATGGE